MVDSKYAAGIYPDDYFNGDEAVNQTKAFTTFITDWTQSTGTATIPTNTASAASDVYEFHRRAGPLSGHYNDAIDMAVQAAAHASALSDKVSDALAFQRGRNFYPIPSGFSYLSGLWADTRTTYLSKHLPATWDTLDANIANRKLAQSFTVVNANPRFVIDDVYLLLSKTGSPTGTFSIELQTNSSSDPAGNFNGVTTTSATVDSATLTAEPTLYRFAFSTPTQLVPGQTYWIVFAGLSGWDATNNVTWAADSDSGYANGIKRTYSGGVWTAATSGDYVFSVRAKQYPDYLRLAPRKHFDVLRDTTRYLVLTDAGMSALEDYSGCPLKVVGQGAPALPTADSSTLEIPYDYAVARAGMHLAAAFKDYVGPSAPQLIANWKQIVADLESKMNPGVRPGSIEVEAL